MKKIGLSLSCTVALLSFTSCGTFRESLSVTNTVLVKVQSTAIHSSPPPSCNGWNFRHVLETRKAEGCQWYVAWNNERPLLTGFFHPYWVQLFSRAPEIADATNSVLGVYPILLEPNRTFVRSVKKDDALNLQQKDAVAIPSSRSMPWRYGNKPSSAWPIPTVTENGWPDAMRNEGDGVKLPPGRKMAIDPIWYLRDRYSQLATARTEVGKPAGGAAIRIGHLDNGFDDRHAGLPQGLIQEDSAILTKYGALSNAVGRLQYEQKISRRESATKPSAPGSKGARASHGLGTLGILAGGMVNVEPQKGVAGYSGYLGGAPYAEVVPVRVAPWVVSLNTAELAYAIDYASRRQQCDILSLSHGGAPTLAWVDAANAAYERGTAIFAAESDFFSINGWPLRPRGVILPASPAYPAGFRRVLGVTGVTASGSSYGSADYWRLLLRPWEIASWVGRGSYGADGTSTVIYRPSRKADRAEVETQGELRAHPIAGYAPNIPWLSMGKAASDPKNDLDLDGGGTSAATPQVAAAAALWLQKNRAAIVRHGDWHSWRKAEAVYYALLRSADRGKKDRADFYLGAGRLKASDALKITYPQAISGAFDRPDLRFAPSPLDSFDGTKSIAAFLGFGTLRQVPESRRATLWQIATPGESRDDALKRLYYNLGILKEWHGGDLPQKKYEKLYWRRADQRVSRLK